MSALERHYTLHDIVSFIVRGGPGLAGWLVGDWEVELRGFRTGRRIDPDFIVTLGGFQREERDCYLLDDRFYVGRDYFYCRDRWRYACWELELSGLEKPPMRVRLNANLPGWLVVPELIIYPLIWFHLNLKGFPVVHASAVARDGKAYLFAGREAAGKTTVALGLLDRGFQLLSDHFVILGRGEALGFPSPLHILDYNLLPQVWARMGTRERLLLRLRGLLRRATGKGLAQKIGLGEMLSLIHI